MNKAEDKLLRYLADNGTDEEREMFLAFQEERNRNMEILVGLIQRLASHIVHLSGTQAAGEIISDAGKLNPKEGCEGCTK